MKSSFILSMLFLQLAFPAIAQELAPHSAKPSGPPLAASVTAGFPRLLEPKLRLNFPTPSVRPRVALTFDACMGQVDQRILSLLVEQRIPATIFVTARWLKRNSQTVAVFQAHPDLFQIENHGENHIPAIDVPVSVYGIASAGSPEAVRREVANGAAAVQAAGFAPPRWFRGSTAKYDDSAIRQIRSMGYKIAGYSVNGDGGSLLGASMTEKRLSAAKDGDVIIAHINQPTHEAGSGVVRGIIALQKRGVQFVRLEDAQEAANAATPNN
ncbi:polysaccharide deacetylase family protein [Rhizobium helianthi]|uniref:Chitooligosaccharide deacetylase n=1 Tax=Rhizobium helianthi TaxID=1132695 RepID=A0ABW4M8H1_9HYPH